MKKKSFVWSHFTVMGQKKRAICHHCNKELSYTLTTMSNLGRHIKTVHPEVLATDGSVEDAPMDVYEEVVPGGTVADELKTYEITMKGFEEMEDMGHPVQDEARDPDWAPGTEGSWRNESGSTGASTSQKKDRKRSAVWNHFNKSPCKTNAICMHCSKAIKLGTISNLARHLRHRHPNISFIRAKAPSLEPSYNVHCTIENNETREEENMLRNELDMCSEVIELNVDSYQHPESVILSRTTMNEEKNSNRDFDFGILAQSSQNESLNVAEDFDMHDYIKPKDAFDAASRIDRLLVKMIVKGCHPVTMVEQSGFKEFVNALNPRYKLPSLDKLTKELIPECYRECESRASKSLQDAEGICLYVDQWKSKTTYMCITAHFINKECKFEPLFLACHIVNADETSSDISQRLLETVTEWEISGKVVAVVTDNSEIMVEAVKMQNWVHIPHFMRALCLVTHESLQVIKHIVTKVRNTMDELKKLPQVIAEIYSKHKSFGQKPTKLITNVKKNWNSSFTTLEMLSRFTILKAAITSVHHSTEYKLSESEWRILKTIVDDVLDVFKEVKQEIIKEERVCMSKIVFYIKSLQRIMNKIQVTGTLPSDAVFVATTAGSLLEKHFQEFLGSELASIISLLDPRLKKYGFFDESEFASACSKLKKEVCEVTVPEPEYIEPDPDSLWFSFDQEIMKIRSVKDPIGKGILEFENYLQEQLLERDQDPLVWWDQRKEIYPRLFKLARKYLCVSTKYTQRESISYKTAYMLSQLRANSPSSSSESELMFLHHNL